jgi:hypothetical protein
MVSVEVGKVRLDMAALLLIKFSRARILSIGEKPYLVSSHICTRLDAVAKRGSVR